MNRTQQGRNGGRAAAAIRPARPTDLAALSDFFAGLSARTRYLRFFAPITPSPALLRLLCGGDGTTDAVVATAGGLIIGHAMAADRAGPQNPEEPQDPRGARMTDIGVVVADAWQGRGVGSALVRALLTAAQARGVTSLAMDVLPGNRQALAMIAGHWPAARINPAQDYITIGVQLPRLQQQRPQARPVARPVAAARATASQPGTPGMTRSRQRYPMAPAAAAARTVRQ